MGIEFYNTVMGRCFFDSTMPRITRALERIADRLEPVEQVAGAPADPAGDSNLAEEVERLTEALRRKTEEAKNLRESTAELMRQRDEALLAGIVNWADMVHVACTECGAEYDQTRLHGDLWPPYCCGACGCRRVVIKPSDIPDTGAKS